MPKFVREKMLGGYAEVADGHSDPECTHVILKATEYDKILNEKRAAERETAVTRADGEQALQTLRRESESRLWHVQEEARKAAEVIAAELEHVKQEAEYQRCLNENLLRISRERANADRNMKPKKERCGYVVLNSEEKEISYKVGSKRLRKTRLWETTIQSPYSVKFQETVVRKQIEDDLFPHGGAWLVGRIGITGKFNDSYERFLEAKEQNPEESFYNGNVVFARQQRLKRNFRSKYWEVAFIHTQPLGDVPEDLTPASKKPV